MAAYKEMDLMLGYVQSAPGTKRTSLNNTNYLAIDKGFELKYVQELNEWNPVVNGFKPQKSFKGNAYYDVVLSAAIAPTASATEPLVSSLLQCSGMKLTTATKKHTYTPTDTDTEYKDITLWMYTGDKASGDCILHKAHSCMFDFKLSGEVGKPSMLQFTGKGIPDGYPAAATYESGAITIPTDTILPVLKATTATINTQSAKILKYEVNMGNTVELIKDPTKDTGYAQCTFPNRKSTFVLTCYQEDQSVSGKQMYTLLDTIAPISWTLKYGPAADSYVTVSTTDSAFLDNVEEGDENGMRIWTLSGHFVNNSWSLVINDGA